MVHENGGQQQISKSFDLGKDGGYHRKEKNGEFTHFKTTIHLRLLNNAQLRAKVKDVLNLYLEIPIPTIISQVGYLTTNDFICEVQMMFTQEICSNSCSLEQVTICFSFYGIKVFHQFYSFMLQLPNSPFHPDFIPSILG